MSFVENKKEFWKGDVTYLVREGRIGRGLERQRCARDFFFQIISIWKIKHNSPTVLVVSTTFRVAVPVGGPLSIVDVAIIVLDL